jgi:hypothetical protein
MKSAIKILGIMAVTAGVGLAGNAAFANCQNEGPYEVRQCAKGTWFAPVPGGGTVATIQWWAIGFGNATSAAPTTTSVSPEGSGFLPAPSATGGNFIGIDSANSTATDIDLVDATTIPGLGAPPGSTCFSSAANWGAGTVDSCIDANRTYTVPGGTSNLSDNYVNIYWGNASGGYLYGPYYESQLDPPMGVLAKDSSGTRFALAFFASEPRPHPAGQPQDITPGQFNMGLITNGAPGLSGNNVVPWQLIPQPTISAVLAVPSDPNSNRNLTVTWTPVPRIVKDNSTRPCFAPDGVTPCATVSVGVGVNDQGTLVHYDLESTPLTSGVCGTAFTKVNSVDHPANTMNGTVGPNTCVRLTTRFGKTPSAVFVATSAGVAGNRTNAQTGKLGDVGFAASSSNTKVGGPLVSQKATLTVATKNKNMVLVGWETSSELSLTGFDILAINAKGDAKVVGSKACTQCTNGLGASYTELIQGNTFQGSKKVQIRLQPSGDLSNTLDLK